MVMGGSSMMPVGTPCSQWAKKRTISRGKSIRGPGTADSGVPCSQGPMITFFGQVSC